MKRYDLLHYDTEPIPISQIHTDRFDREDSNPLNIDILKDEIAKNGSHTEIWVRKDTSLNRVKDYILISGHRRLLAAKELDNKVNIKARIYSVDEIASLYMTCSENSNRLNYDNFERINNFLYIAYKELIKSKINHPPEYNPTQMAGLVTMYVLKIIHDNTKDDTNVVNHSREEKEFISIVKKVQERTGLFHDYDPLYRMLKVIQMSPTLKKFCKDKSYRIKIMTILAGAEKSFGEELMPSADDAKKIKVMDSVLAEVKKLPHTAIKEIAQVISRHKHIIKTQDHYGSSLEEKAAELSPAIEELAKIMRDPSIDKAVKTKAIKLSKHINKELEQMRKLINSKGTE